MEYIDKLKKEIAKISENEIRIVKSLEPNSILIPKLDPIMKSYINDMQGIITEQIDTYIKSDYRWLALVYNSSVLERLMANNRIYFLKGEEHNKIKLMQDVIFDWYETKAESSNLLSLFQMALTKDFDHALCPYFGFVRYKQIAGGNLLDISEIFSESFVRFFHDLLWDAIKNDVTENPNSILATYKIVDEIIEIACQSILCTGNGFSSVLKLKYQLSKITGNWKIARRSEHDILASLICINIVDPDWTHYYYFPYVFLHTVPYGALAIACKRKLNLDSYVSNKLKYLSEIFDLFEIIETKLLDTKKDLEKEWGTHLKIMNSPKENNITITQMVNDLKKHFEDKLDVNLCMDFNVDKGTKHIPKIMNKRAAFLDLSEDRANQLIIYRNSTPLRSIEIKSLLKDFEEKAPNKLELPDRFSSNFLNFKSLLDIDLISSSKIFARISEYSRINSYTFFRLLKEFYEYAIYGNGALRTNETPDGWMCCFDDENSSLMAALSLLKEIKEFNSLLHDKYAEIYKYTDNGIGIRIGLHVKSISMELSTSIESLADEALNLTGHFQKKGGDEFKKFTTKLDDDSILWVLTISKETFEVLNSSANLINEFNSIEKIGPFITQISNHDVYIFGQTKR
ncbi:MAG: hypothetical protein WC879_05780 [Melioribacteraceae bacterium]